MTDNKLIELNQKVKQTLVPVRMSNKSWDTSRNQDLLILKGLKYKLSPSFIP